MTAAPSAPSATLPVPPPRRAGGPRRWCVVAAVTTAGAGVLHVLAAMDHLGGGKADVGFFVVTALGQLATAAGLAVAAMTGRRLHPRLLTGILAATVGLIGLYLVAHTTDLLAAFTAADGHAGPVHDPLGPVALSADPPRAGEPPGLLGTVTVAVELLSVVAITALLPERRRRLSGNLLLVLGAGAWLLWLIGVLA